RALYQAVHEWWSGLPRDDRPQLVLYGVSRGAEALLQMFDDIDDLVGGVDGAIFAGTPAGTPLTDALRASRDEGSPVMAPVVSEVPQVQFFPDADAARRFSGTWAAPRLAFLEHANDPVVWMDFSIF